MRYEVTSHVTGGISIDDRYVQFVYDPGVVTPKDDEETHILQVISGRGWARRLEDGE